jgi:hypothetical protein
MSNTFNFKFFTISGVAIATVIIIFKTVTAYGENNLSATPLINKTYHLSTTQNLPNCEKINTLVLNIQQSGIYLNASLQPLTNKTDIPKPLSLRGLLNNQQLELSGNIDNSIFCQIPEQSNNPTQQITLQISKINQKNLHSKITINNLSQTLEFTALPQTDQQINPQLQSH